MMTSVIPYLLSCTQDEDHGRSRFVGDDGMTVTMLGDGMLRVDSRLSPGCNIMYEFRKCMFNELFTFSRVGLYPDRTYLSLSDFLVRLYPPSIQRQATISVRSTLPRADGLAAAIHGANHTKSGRREPTASQSLPTEFRWPCAKAT